jgi:hypothetical protein
MLLNTSGKYTQKATAIMTNMKKVEVTIRIRVRVRLRKIYSKSYWHDGEYEER